MDVAGRGARLCVSEMMQKRVLTVLEEVMMASLEAFQDDVRPFSFGRYYGGAKLRNSMLFLIIVASNYMYGTEYFAKEPHIYTCVTMA